MKPYFKLSLIFLTCIGITTQIYASDNQIPPPPTEQDFKTLNACSHYMNEMGYYLGKIWMKDRRKENYVNGYLNAGWFSNFGYIPRSNYYKDSCMYAERGDWCKVYYGITKYGVNREEGRTEEQGQRADGAYSGCTILVHGAERHRNEIMNILMNAYQLMLQSKPIKDVYGRADQYYFHGTHGTHDCTDADRFNKCELRNTSLESPWYIHYMDEVPPWLINN